MINTRAHISNAPSLPVILLTSVRLLLMCRLTDIVKWTKSCSQIILLRQSSLRASRAPNAALCPIVRSELRHITTALFFFPTKSVCLRRCSRSACVLLANFEVQTTRGLQLKVLGWNKAWPGKFPDSLSAWDSDAECKTRKYHLEKETL